MSTQREPFTNHTAIDDLEPEEEQVNEYREISLQYLRVLRLIFEYLATQSYSKAATIGVGISLGIYEQGMSQRQLATLHGLSSGTISHHTATFCEIADLPKGNE